MPDKKAQRDWVDRVLGVTVPDDEPPVIGGRRTRDVKATLAAMTVPTVPAGYERLAPMMAERLLKFSNQRAGALGGVGGDPYLERPELIAAAEALAQRRATLQAEIDAERREEDRRRAAVAKEAEANEALVGRVTVLGAGGFGTGYFSDALSGLATPDKEPEAGIDARDAGRRTLDRELDEAGRFKAGLGPLLEADTALLALPATLREGFGVSRPDLPDKGIAAADDLPKMAGADGKIGTWAASVTEAGTFAPALAAFDKARAAAKPETWPKGVSDSIAAVRSGAESTAKTAAAALTPFTPALNALKEGVDSAAAAGRFAAKHAELEEKAKAFPPRIKMLADWFIQLAEPAVIAKTATASVLDNATKDLTDAEAAIPEAIAYEKAHGAVEKDFATYKAKLKPPLPEVVTKARDGVSDLLNATDTLAKGMEWSKAEAEAGKAAKGLEEAVLARTAALVPTAGAAKTVHDGLLAAKDKEGGALLARLYLEFGETDMPRLLAGMTGARQGADPASPAAGLTPEKTAENLAALGTSLGTAGLKTMLTALGGSTPAAFKGGDNLGIAMSNGMDPKRIADLYAGFDMGNPAGAQELTRVFGTAFAGDAQVFATIATKGMRFKVEADAKLPGQAATDPKTYDPGVVNLKRLAVAFPDTAELKTLVDGVKAPDLTFPSAAQLAPGASPTEQKKVASLLEAEAAARAAKRMQCLLKAHAGGDPAKLKTTFFNQVDGFPNAEWNGLNAIYNAEQSWKAQPVNNRGPQPRPYTEAMNNRYNRLNAAAVDHTDKQILIRNAATLTTGWVSPDDPPPPPSGVPVPSAQLGGLRCTAADQRHFEERHLRTHNTLQPPALAEDTTQVGDPQDKTTTFWPEGTTTTLVKTMLKEAVANAGPAEYWYSSSYNDRWFNNPIGRHHVETEFMTTNQDVTHSVTIAGRPWSGTLSVRLGVLRTTTTTERWPLGSQAPTVYVEEQLTQFYPRQSGALDTIGFEAMQMAKAALGKRQWPGGLQP